MARYTGPKCRICRREGTKLFLKGQKCYGAKCTLERRTGTPGQHGQRRSKLSDYGEQLREKQKIRMYYGMLEKQFKIFFKRASRRKGVTGDNLLQALELRLDNVVYRLGFATTKSMARQMIRHGHILVNGKKMDIPSAVLKAKDKIEIQKKESIREQIKVNLEITANWEVPQWLKADRKALRGEVLNEPERHEIVTPAREQLIVELYSK